MLGIVNNRHLLENIHTLNTKIKEKMSNSRLLQFSSSKIRQNVGVKIKFYLTFFGSLNFGNLLEIWCRIFILLSHFFLPVKSFHAFINCLLSSFVSVLSAVPERGRFIGHSARLSKFRALIVRKSWVHTNLINKVDKNQNSNSTNSTKSSNSKLSKK